MPAPPLPYRGRYGDPRPAALSALALPPQPLPARLGLRPLKAWRYVGVFGSEVMLCAATVRIGPAHQTFWAVWERDAGILTERTRMGRDGVRLPPGRVAVDDRGVSITLTLEEHSGVESVCATGERHAWTRKQGGVLATGTVVVHGRRHTVRALAVIDDTAAYYARHTVWRWSAGVGCDARGRAVAWNLVAGVNDPPRHSERTVWVDGVPHEVGPVAFAEDLSAVGGLRFSAEAVRERAENRLLIRSRYRQPFGTFRGAPSPGVDLVQGFGVMEFHDVRW